MSATKNKEQPVNRNASWKLAVVGLSDGMILSLTLTTILFVVTNERNSILLIAGIAALAGALVIGTGGYFAAKFRMESLTLRSEEEQKRLNTAETQKTITLFKHLDLGSDMQEQAAHEIEKDSEEWKAFVQKNEQPFEVPDKKQLPVAAFIIGFSYLAGALFPLLSYAFVDELDIAFKAAVVSTLIVLPVVGYIKSAVNGEPQLWGALRLLLLGVAAVTCGWMLALVFATFIP